MTVPTVREIVRCQVLPAAAPEQAGEGLTTLIKHTDTHTPALAVREIVRC